MAKKHTAKHRKSKWRSGPNDAIRLAAIRWYAMNIEQLAIEIYATDRNKFDGMVALLQKQSKELFRFGLGPGGFDIDDCADGYVLCKDGLCAPMCDAHGGGNTNL